ncbi:MAG TPA: carboxypeptidase-like regulatory domain-containing protein, partial [Puia sp.]|nr:carboxypeptidase-like regulatory domain-containing protein [Puia sp.]
MKTTAFMLLVFCLHVSGRGLSQTVTISGRNIPLSKVFTVIKKQTGYTVFGNASLLQQTSPVSISVSGMPLTQFLDSILRHEAITYRILDRTIILYKRPAPAAPGQTNGATRGEPGETMETQDAPWQIITGYVVAEDGSVLEGVNVKIKGTGIGASTDSTGKFTIDARPDQVLVFTHVNMMTREMRVKDFPVNGRIVLKHRDARLNDVVVTGYGTIRKESFTGTYTQVTKADIQKVSSNNLIGALQVFDPSFRIMQNIDMGSNPNILPEFYIRGQSGFPSVLDLDKQTGSSVSQFSLRNNPNTPIFIMDGFEVDVEKVYDMDINRISNVTILKDAAATAMYGSRASNGVIVIETIAPKAGEFRTTYSGSYSVTTPDLSSYHMMNAQQKLDAENAAQIYLPQFSMTDPNYQTTLIENLYKQQMKKNEILKGVNTYWLSQPLSAMFNHKHNVYIEGGSQAMRVGLELKYDDQNGVMKESFRRRIGAGLTVQYQTGKLQIRNQAYFDAVSADDSPFGKFSDYSRLEPYYPIRDENTGKYLQTFPMFDDRSPVPNPLYESTVGNFSKDRYREWTDNFTANYYLNKFLFIRGQFALDYKQDNTEAFTSPASTIYYNATPFTKGELLQS